MTTESHEQSSPGVIGKIKKVLNPSKEEETSSSKTSSSRSATRSSKPTSSETKKIVEATPTSEQVIDRQPTQPTALSPSQPKVIDAQPSPANTLDAAQTTQTQKVVAPVTHNVVKHQETEEVLRTREHDRHIHHVQHHVQPVQDTEVRDEVHHTKIAPTEVIKENKLATAEDAAAFESLGTQFKDTVTHAPTKRDVVDLGEKVEVKEHHHVHNVIQPVIQKETHDRHRIHTTVPIHHVSHEAPIIHNSISHEPLKMEDFIKRGGSINSNATHSDISKQLLTESTSGGIGVPAVIEKKNASVKKDPSTVDKVVAAVDDKLKF